MQSFEVRQRPLRIHARRRSASRRISISTLTPICATSAGHDDTMIKICGLSTPDAVDRAARFHADMAGFIFFEKSPRHVGDRRPAI
jgi:hypothetical protein